MVPVEEENVPALGLGLLLQAEEEVQNLNLVVAPIQDVAQLNDDGVPATPEGRALGAYAEHSRELERDDSLLQVPVEVPNGHDTRVRLYEGRLRQGRERVPFSRGALSGSLPGTLGRLLGSGR